MKRRVFSRRRDVDELPPQVSGTVLVFETGGRYEAFTERRHLTGAEEAVVDAVAVSLVDVRQQLVTVDLPIPSSNPGNDFYVRVRFDCVVTHAETVVARRLTNVVQVLGEHLRRDRKLVELGIDHSIDELNAVRSMANARVTAYCTLEPPMIPGLSVKLSTVDVLTPGELRSHGKQIQAVEWKRKLKEFELSGQRASAEFLNELISRGPEMTSALALDRGEVTAAQIADQLREERHRQDENLLTVLKHLSENNALNRIGYDPVDLINRVTQAQLGIQPAQEVGPNHRRRSVTSADSEKPGFAPNEDDVV
ncbi:hypothetical protein [Lentzea sp. CC55]|uniref:hypothetical protein n=1 Tax=Lentzea sp. CC55 TaxID=2884909 RepID=UPI001F318997|nr:hypothetical protein [Lentzea sp. CC55]MCG8924689.1 hypothetical protein [Lentzea sp. CC55]